MGKNKTQKIVTIVCISIISLIVVGFAVYGAIAMLNNGKMPADTPEKEITTTTVVTTVPEIPKLWWEVGSGQSEFLELTMDKIVNGHDDLHTGDLILVNSTWEYFPEDTAMSIIYDFRNGIKYGTKDRNQVLPVRIINQINSWLSDFENFSGNKGEVMDVVVNSAYRTRERQTELYTNGDPSVVAKPGHSEHETGLAFDLSLNLDGHIVEFNPVGDFTWIAENSANYGFILRYPADKVGITGISYEPWHYRYVGIPHATYIMENKLCLEDYILELEKYRYDKEHLYITVNSNIYEVYFVPADSASDTTLVPVYNNVEYTVSGNNSTGFIVTVDRGTDFVIPEPEITTQPVVLTEETTAVS